MKKTSKHLKRKEINAMKREAFMLRYERGLCIVDIARRFEKSRRTIVRWVWDVKHHEPCGDLPSVKQRCRQKTYPAFVFDRIVALKKENVRRTAVDVHRLLAREGIDPCPSISLVRKHIVSQGLNNQEPRVKTGYIQFARDKPNDLWQVDIAGVQTIGGLGKLYLFALLDDCSRYIVAARYFKDQKGINVLRLLRDAFEEYGRPNQILADNGTQFKNVLGELGTRYSKLLDLVGVDPIFARANHPQTKGKLERWFGTVIKTFLNEARFHVTMHPETSFEDFNVLFQDWIHWYNHEKDHRSLPGHVTPASMYFNQQNRVHRPLETSIDWAWWFTCTTTRRVSKYNAISYKRETILLPPGYAGNKVDILDTGEKFEIYFRETCLVVHDVDPDYMKAREKKFSRTVSPNGLVKYQQSVYNVGSLLAGKKVIVKETNNGRKIAVFFNETLLAEFDKKIVKKNNQKRKRA